ncbi:MAG: hypothetical protein LBG66_06220 [Gallionellaceae bacterium]|jgi:hypothetical protein|nr:hypothetical protein [Gallionellaceae bacterium]
MDHGKPKKQPPAQVARECDEYLRSKVERAHVFVQAGVGIPHEEIEAAALRRHADETDWPDR